jgi:hypothetical protein
MAMIGLSLTWQLTYVNICEKEGEGPHKVQMILLLSQGEPYYHFDWSTKSENHPHIHHNENLKYHKD